LFKMTAVILKIIPEVLEDDGGNLEDHPGGA
jgi:hypothetical protein